MITQDEVQDFGTRFFNAVASGASAAEQAQFFLDPHARIYIAWNGATISLEDHERLHAQWINEHHSFGHFDLTPLNASPERVQARGTVYWQAEFPERPPTKRDQGRRRGRLDQRAYDLRRAKVRSLHQQ